MTFTKRQERAVRTLAALPDDDWQPHDWESFEQARKVLADELRVIERRRKPPKRKPDIPNEVRRALWKRSGGRCEFFSEAGFRCANTAQDPHHKGGRVGPGAHTLDNLMHVCRTHHDWIGDHPEEARRLGYQTSRIAPYGYMKGFG